MIKSNRKLLSVLLAALACGIGSPLNASAQGAEGPLVLRLPVSARTLGMGNANLAITDADAVFTNPGMLVNARGMSLSLQTYGSASTTGSVSTVSTIGSLTVGVGVQQLNWRTARTTYADAVGAGGSALSDGGANDAVSQAVTVGIGRTIKGKRFGISARYAQEHVYGIHAGTLAFDLGFSMPLGPASLAIVAQNLGADPELNGDPIALPRRFGVGLGGGMLTISEHFDLGAQTQVMVEADGFVRPGGGIELAYVPIDGVSLVWRQGLRLPREPDEPLITAGLGVTVDRWSLDYAMEPMRGGRPVSHRVGIRLR